MYELFSLSHIKNSLRKHTPKNPHLFILPIEVNTVLKYKIKAEALLHHKENPEKLIIILPVLYSCRVARSLLCTRL